MLKNLLNMSQPIKVTTLRQVLKQAGYVMDMLLDSDTFGQGENRSI